MELFFIDIYLEINKTCTTSLKLFNNFSYSQITTKVDKTCFLFKLLLILTIHKLAIKRDAFDISNTSEILIHSLQVDQFVCTRKFTKSFKNGNA